MSYIDYFKAFQVYIPGVLGALLLLVLALFLAFLLKRLVIRGLRSINFDEKVQHWGMARNESEGHAFIETIGSMINFLVLLFFLPGVLAGLNVGGIMNPIVNMFDKFFNYIPNILLAILILVIGAYFGKFIKKLVKNLLSGLNIDKWYHRLTNSQNEFNVNDNQFAEVIATIVYVLIFIPVLTVALETLGIQSISQPIVSVLNEILSAIPKIVTAVVLLVIGVFIANLVGDLVENVVATTGVDKYSRYLNFKVEYADVNISSIVATILKVILILFFAVEAISILQLNVLNSIGASIIAYIPLVLSSIIILGVVLIGGNILANFVSKATGNQAFAEMVRYIIIILGVFMILEQLQIAQTIVNAGFIIILGSIGLSMAIAFGLGGREFAARQLKRADKALEASDQEKKNKNHSESSIDN